MPAPAVSFVFETPCTVHDRVEQRLATYGIRSLLSSHRQEDLTLDALATTTGNYSTVELRRGVCTVPQVRENAQENAFSKHRDWNVSTRFYFFNVRQCLRCHTVL